MVPYRKYILLWQKFKNGEIHSRLVDLGFVKDNNQPVITTNTYCYQIIFSQLELNDLADDEFFESEEIRNSVANYIGEEYKYPEFHKKYPKKIMNSARLNPGLFHIVVAHPIGYDTDVFETVFSYGRHNVYTKKEVESYVKVVTPEELCKEYKFHLFF